MNSRYTSASYRGSSLGAKAGAGRAVGASASGIMAQFLRQRFMCWKVWKNGWYRPSSVTHGLGALVPCNVGDTGKSLKLFGSWSLQEKRRRGSRQVGGSQSCFDLELQGFGGMSCCFAATDTKRSLKD